MYIKNIEAILDLINDGIIIIDEKGVISFFNKGAERITKLRAEDVKGGSAADVIPDTQLHIVIKNGNPEFNKEQKICDTVVSASLLPIHDENDRITGAVSIFSDMTKITDLASQVSDLWEAQTLLEAVIDSTEDAISVADEKGNNIIVNPAYTRITGLPRESVLNKPVTVDIAESESMHMQVLKTGKSVHNVRLKVGPLKKEVIVNVAPIFIDSKMRGSVGVIHDISEIMSLTKELGQARKLIRHLQAKYTWDDIIGQSLGIEWAKEQAGRAAETSATVILLGESGTGKELFAHAIHNASRRKGQFVRVNCAALSENLLESELFGYEEGAFTGASKGGKKGLFEEAGDGTIFLDEIGEISFNLQSKLLRVIQEKELIRVGGTHHIPVDLRFVVATHADLKKKVKEGTFREDLYYRLNMIPIFIVPLRERREDIPLLAEHIIYKLNQEFGREVKEVSEDVMEIMQGYSWPGNIRELENTIARAMMNIRPHEKRITREYIPPLNSEHKQGVITAEIVKVLPLNDAMAQAEKSVISNALKKTGGSKKNAADLLNISIRNLYYKIDRHGIKQLISNKPPAGDS
jgi:PAS domain S-box-containing protein